MRTSRNRRAQAMLAQIVRSLGIVLTRAFAMCDVVDDLPVALTRHLRRAIGQEVHIASQDNLGRALYTAIALRQPGLGLLGNLGYRLMPGCARGILWQRFAVQHVIP